jgi:hypothetical protein
MTFDKIEELIKKNSFSQAELMVTNYLEHEISGQKAINDIKSLAKEYDKCMNKLQDLLNTARGERGARRDLLREECIAKTREAKNILQTLNELIQQEANYFKEKV